MDFEPETVDTSHTILPPEIASLTERLAGNAHNIWARQRIADGWRYGPELNDARKENPRLVPYDQLTESERQYDRNVVVETLKTVITLGFRIEK
jgi:hypothetical protein